MLENRTGKELVAIGAQETSSIVVETVAKYSKGHGNVAPVLPHFKSDATKVTSKGMGLKKAFLGKQNQFTINATEAGKCQTKYRISCLFLRHLHKQTTHTCRLRRRRVFCMNLKG